MGACPGVYCAVITIVTVIAQRGGNEGVSGQSVGVELGKRPHFSRAKIMVVVGHSGTVSVAAVVIQGRDVLSGIARGGTASRGPFHITSRRTPRQPNLAEDVVIRRPAGGRGVAVVHRRWVVDPGSLPNVLGQAVLRGVGLGPVAEVGTRRSQGMHIGHGGGPEADAA